MKDLKQEYAKVLIALSPNLTADDKQLAEEQLPYSRPTIEKYLKGEVPKIEPASRMIQFFSEIVNKRIKDLKETLAA